MKHLDTLQKSERLRTAKDRWRLWTFMLLAIFVGTAGSYAQDKVTWNQAALESNPLTVLTDTDLSIDFTPSQNLSSATIEIKLPAGISYKNESLSEGVNNAAAIPTASWESATSTIKLTYASTVSTRSHIKLSVQAACTAPDGTIAVKVLTGTTHAGARDIAFTVQTPVIRGTTTIGSGTGLLEVPTVGNTGAFTLNLSTTNGEVKGAVITLSYLKGLVLSDIYFNGAAATATIEETKTTITLAEADILGATAKSLTFKARSERCGVYTITPSASFGCATYTDELTNLTLAYPTIPGTPNMKYLDGETGFLKTDLTTALANRDVPMDGTTVSYFKLAYQNIGSADAYDIVVNVDAWRNGEGKYNYFAVDGTNPIKYSVDGGVTKTPLIATDYDLSIGLASNGRRQVKGTIAGKNTRAVVRIPANLEKNKKLIIYFPVAGGAIYDNSAYMSTTLETNIMSSINWYSYFITANNACGVKGSVPSATYGKGAYEYPRITGAIPATSIPAGGNREITFPFYAGDNSLHRTVDIVVQLPEWLELEDTPANSIKFNNNTPSGSGSKGTDTYYARYINSGSGTVTVKYKTKADLSSYSDEEDKIRIWINWNMNDLSNTSLEYFTQVFQDISLIKNPKGITLDDFKLVRDPQSRGYKDSNNNNIPDDGTKAPEGDIDHRLYLRSDEGRIKVKASIPSTESSTYSRMYLLVSSPLLNMSGTHLGFNAGTLQKNTDGSETVTLTKVSDKQYYLEYISGSGAELQAGDILNIEIPFKVGTSVIEAMSGISVEAYVTNTEPSNKFAPSDRNGKDLLSFGFGSYGERFNAKYRGTVLPFENNNAKDYFFHRIMTLENTPLSSPYFSKEVRQLVSLKNYTIEMPVGYMIADNEHRIEIRKSSTSGVPSDGINPVSIFLKPTSGPTTTANGTTSYTYDLSSLFTDAYTDANLMTDKWPLPYERFTLGAYANVQATKFAEPTSSIKTTVIYDNKVTGENDLPEVESNQVTYSGPRISLSTNGITSIDAVSSDLLISPVTVGNPNTDPIKEVWLYVGGDVNNIELRETDGTLVSSGTGLDGRWLKVESNNTLPPGFSKNYGIGFTYTGTGASNVEIYIASGFSDSWAPTLTADISSQNSDYTSTPLLVGIKGASARIDGSLSVESGYILTHDIAYTLTGSLNSESSVGVLKDPTMTLKVPAKQKYIAGTAKVEYPKGNGFATNTALDNALKTLFDKANPDDLPTATTDFVLDLSSVVTSLPGFNGTTDPNDLVISFSAQFSPQCGTQLDGMRYNATLGGKDFSGADALGSGRTAISSQLLPNVTSAYTFAITTSFKDNDVSNRTAFNENITSNTLYVDIKKEGTAALNTNNRLRVEIPDIFTVGAVNAPITVNGDLFGGNKTVTIESIEPSTGTNTNIYYITLPTSDYVVTDNGDGKTVRFEIPLSYTSAEAHKDNPELKFNASVVTLFQFGTCPGTSYAPIGIPTEGQMAVVRATASSYNATIDEDTSLEILSDNFGGTWYQSDKATVLSTDNPYLFNGEDEGYTAGPHTLYVSAVFNGVDYGTVPVLVTVYPSLDYTLNTPSPYCDEQTFTVAQFAGLLSDTQPSDVTYKFYKTNTGGVLSDEVTTTQTISSTTSYWVESDNTYAKGTPKELVITINDPIVLDPITGAINLEGTTSTSVTINVASGTADGNGEYTYKLYDKTTNNQIGSDQTNGLFTLNHAALQTSEASKTYTYYVMVQGAASCSATQSDDIVVNIYPAPALDVNTTLNTAFCSTDPTLTGGIQLNSYIQNINTIWFNYTYSINGAAYVTLDNSVELPKTAGTYAISLKAKNTMTGSSLEAPGSVTIVVTDPVVLNPVTTPVDLEGAGNATINATLAGNSGAADTYKLYDNTSGTASLKTTQSNGDFSVAHATITDISVPYESYTYYITAQGATSCVAAQSNPVEVRVYPVPTLTLSAVPLTFCETDATLQGGIDLFSYIANPNTTWYAYTYTGEGVTDGALTAGSVTIPTAVGTYNYTLKAVNQLTSSSLEATQSITINVEQKTTIDRISGNEVTEGDAITIVVDATGTSLQYEWYEGSNTIPLAVTSVNTYEITPSSSIAANNGKIYRVVVKGAGSCTNPERTFSLNVKSRVIPPVGNNRVTWEVIGYGKVEVKADGISISNGSHVNNGANLVITGTTWGSNVLESITINGSAYSSPTVSYTVNGGNVHIVVEFNGSDPNPDPNSNADIEDGTRIWTEGGYVCIYTETATRAHIITFNGRLVTDQKLSEGESRIQLPDGYYIVTLSNGKTAKIAVRNY